MQQGMRMKKYKVKRGDTLRRIALLFYNDPNKYIVIADENKINNPYNIKVGQVLIIPEEISKSIKTKRESKKYNGLRKYHRAFAGGVRWKLTEEGLEIEGSGIERSKGSPQTVTRIWNK